jgi:hypothetical protein
MVAWIYVTSLADGDNSGVISKNAYGAKWQYLLGVKGVGTTYQVRGWKSDSSTNVDDRTYIQGDTTTITKNAWHHIAIVINDTDLRVYVDGALDNASPPADTKGIYQSTGNFFVGSMLTNGGNGLQGYIDEVAVFARDLSAAEVLDIKTNGLSGNKGASD